jgi:NitT/TauT family transport system permease protein
MLKNKRSQTFAFCLGILLVGLLVQLAGSLRGDRLIFPGVRQILAVFFRLLGEAGTWQKILVTLLHLAEALALSVLLGLLLGLAEGFSPFVRNLLRPLMITLRSLPMIVLVILIMVLANYSLVPLIATSLVLIPILSEAVCEGLLSIEPELLDVYRMNSSLNLRVLGNVHLPLMAGYLKQSWVNAVGMGLKVAVTTEYLVQSRNSLGKAVFSSLFNSEYAEIYAWALIMILLILVLTGIPPLIRKLVRA